ncbi:MAG TPA: hypothetical protein VNN22_24440 [Verrucomicrobiae bacterium]|nr:hypothetical protein [Verrucomicrobiae bacterium]
MKSFIQLTLWPTAVGTFLIFAAAGCGRDSVKVYHVDANDTATPTPPPMAAPGAMPTSMPDGLPAPDNSGLPSLQYTLPAGWEKKALTQMRVASFTAAQDGKQADVSVIPLAGTAGTDPANVNRWRGQVGLTALPETELAKLAEKVTIGDLPAELYDLAGTAPGSGDAERIIGVILHRDDAAWFFKMTGDAGVVEAQKPAFVAFLKSISFGAPAAAPTAMDMSQLPASHPPIGGMNPGMPATSVPAGDKPTWTVPTGWQEGPLAQFLIAKYVITGSDGASAAVNVSSLAGDGGGLLPNVNRWRTQLGLAPMAEADLANLPTIDASGGKATLIEFSGTDGRTGKPAQLIGVVLPLDGQTWFYKLMGDATVVARQKEALVKFVQSAKYPDAH